MIWLRAGLTGSGARRRRRPMSPTAKHAAATGSPSRSRTGLRWSGAEARPPRAPRTRRRTAVGPDDWASGTPIIRRTGTASGGTALECGRMRGRARPRGSRSDEGTDEDESGEPPECVARRRPSTGSRSGRARARVGALWPAAERGRARGTEGTAETGGSTAVRETGVEISAGGVGGAGAAAGSRSRSSRRGNSVSGSR
jgi:hypothetical protein